MARIRSLKPDFFEHEGLCALGPWHRLCFAGIWTQADKRGRLKDRPRLLKVRIFPYDDLDFEALLTDLATAGFIIRYVVDAERYICIPESSWDKHQRPRRDEHESDLPSVTCATDTYTSLRSDESVTTQCVGSREVGSREVGGSGTPGADAPPPAPLTRTEDLQELWNTITTPPIPRCRDMTEQRRKKARIRLRERPLDGWREVIERVQASEFCRGSNNRGWRATLDWLLENQDNAVKVLEGKYDDRPGPQPVAEKVDWQAECAELHNSDCGSGYIHNQRKALDAKRSA